MRAVQLDHVEAALDREPGGTREVIADLVHVGARDLARHLHRAAMRQRGRTDDFPIALVERDVRALEAELRRAFPPGVPELEADLRRRALVHELDDAAPA